MPKVVLFTGLTPEIVGRLTASAPSDFELVSQPITLPDEEKIQHLQDADFLILFPGRISASVLRTAPQLRLIQLVSVGYDQMDLALCRELNIPVATNGGTNSLDVAEHTLMLILAFYRRLVELDHNVRTDHWRAIDTGLTTYTLDGKTVGIVGLGQIGQRVARLTRAFGAQCIYYDPYPQKPEVEQNLGVTRTSLETLLQQADIVTLHVPLLESTQNLIGVKELALMKPTALLVNTCRGPVIDEAALIETLRERRIGGAALDVLAQEPPDPNNPILRLDNVLLTPHTAGVTYDTWPRRGEFIFRNIARVWAGEPPLAAVTGG
jgi:phosphoglycerate dehydrogenase-like enzyme